MSIAGGTDLAGAFTSGLPTLPVYAGEMQCRALGLKVEAWDDAGRPLLDEVGELVCTAPLPSMPLCFWNDAGGQRYRRELFRDVPRCMASWRLAAHGATPRAVGDHHLWPFGRDDQSARHTHGDSELYRAVEALPEILDTLVVDLEYLGRESTMLLFVVLREGSPLDEPLKMRVIERIRSGAFGAPCTERNHCGR